MTAVELNTPLSENYYQPGRGGVLFYPHSRYSTTIIGDKVSSRQISFSTSFAMAISFTVTPPASWVENETPTLHQPTVKSG